VAKQHGLGRGLGALIPESADQASGDRFASTVPLGRIRPNPNQPRKDFDQAALKELADSISVHGVIQPIIAEDDGSGGYVIIAGERRWRASQMAGLREVPVIVRKVSEPERLEMALIENIQREDLNPLEEAHAYKALMELSGAAQDEIAKKVGKDRSTVANAIRLLKLPAECQEGLRDGSLSAGHARALLSVVNPADQAVLRKRIVEDGLSVRQAEEEARELNAGKRAAGKASAKKTPAKRKPVDIADVEQRLIARLGTKVSISGGAKKGKIVIEYYSSEDLDRVLEIVKA